ncbi:MAG: YihY/virulence factor BrkB family protein [Ignavibacteriales bacterium]|nr:YihY/virulence factor BrkB family protein [Ignavibacteriales bacterium]
MDCCGSIILLRNLLLYFLCTYEETRWRFISAGSTMATILALITSLGFSYFVNNFGQYNKLYGSIGTIMVILLWLYFNSFALILGFELNASINNARYKKHYLNPNLAMEKNILNLETSINSNR